MAESLTLSQEDAMAYLYGGGDEKIECASTSIVVTRFKHACCSIYHGQRPRHLPAGSRVVRETAKVDGRFGTAYTCMDCIKKALVELAR